LYRAVAELYEGLENLPEAIKATYTSLSFFKEAGKKREVLHSSEILYNLHEMHDNIPEAYAILKEYTVLKNEIFNETTKTAEILMNIRYETQKAHKEVQLATMRREKAEILLLQQEEKIATTEV
jgi:hypothetical protein